MGFSFPFFAIIPQSARIEKGYCHFRTVDVYWPQRVFMGGFTRKHRKLNMNLYVLTAGYSISGKSASQRESLYKYIIKFVAINII